MDEYQRGFISNLKFYRKKEGISQARLAELCDVSNGTIGNIECGVTKPSFDLLILMARVLNIQPEQLFHLEQDATREECAERGLSPRQKMKVQEALTAAIADVVGRL